MQASRTVLRTSYPGPSQGGRAGPTYDAPRTHPALGCWSEGDDEGHAGVVASAVGQRKPSRPLLVARGAGGGGLMLWVFVRSAVVGTGSRRDVGSQDNRLP